MAPKAQDFNGPNARYEDEYDTSLQPEYSLKELLDECGKFRILIVGQAGVGKSTICAKVFGISAKMAGVSSQAIGTKNSQVWKEISKPGRNKDLIIHDSGGFSVGDDDAALNEIKKFIKSRRSKTSLSEQIHCIWYCISSVSDRSVVQVEKKFFEEVDLGDIPVVVIFTKFDQLEDRKFGELKYRYRKTHRGAPLPDDLEKTAHNEAVTFYDEKLRPPLYDIIGLQSPYGVERVAIPDAKDDDDDTVEEDPQGMNDLILKTLDRITRNGLKYLLVAAQRESADAKIKGSIELSLALFWGVKVPTSVPFLPFIGATAIYVAFTKIVSFVTKQWRLNDPDKLLEEASVRRAFLGGIFDVGVAARIGVTFLVSLNILGPLTEANTTVIILKMIAGTTLIHERLFWKQKAKKFAALSITDIQTSVTEFRRSEKRKAMAARIEYDINGLNCYVRSKCQKTLTDAVDAGKSSIIRDDRGRKVMVG